MTHWILNDIKQAMVTYKSKGAIQLTRTLPWYVLKRLTNEQKEFYLRTLFRYRLYKLKYTALRDPFEPIWVEPSKISHRGGQTISKNYGIGYIKSGDWDTHKTPFEENTLYQGLKQRYEKKLDWEETTYVKSQIERVENGDSPEFAHDDINEFINNRCEFVDGLYDSMQKEGYIYNENEHIDHNNTNLGRKRKLRPFTKLEPLVVIGRDGEILLRDGNHRLSIAKILEIDSIPVHVLARHKQWQATKEKINSTKSKSNLEPELQQYTNHPDIKDIF